MNKNIVYADSQTFQTMIESNTLVFVDFYADWCGPCKMIAPSIEKLAEEFDGTVRFVKLNIDENPHIAREFDVKSIPTLMIFRSGKPFRRMVGASPVGHYRGELQKVVSKAQGGKDNIVKL
jgi:thioredoxin